jgi:hypothetical protein
MGWFSAVRANNQALESDESAIFFYRGVPSKITLRCTGMSAASTVLGKIERELTRSG